MVQNPFDQQEQKVKVYFFVSSFLIPFILTLFFAALCIAFIPDLVELCKANAGFQSTLDSSVVYTTDAEQAAFLEARGMNVVLVSEEEAKEAMAAQASAFRAKMLPYVLYWNMAYHLLLAIAYLLWLRVFVFQRDFFGFRLGLKGTRGALELTYKRLGQIAWALAWRWFVAWCAFSVAACCCFGVASVVLTKVNITILSLIWKMLMPVLLMGLCLYAMWRICAFLVESLLKIQFNDFNVVFVQNVEKDMVHQIRKDLFKQAPAVTMRLRLPTLEHWSGA
jgi:hypothetical protein